MKGGASAAQTALGIGHTLNESHTQTLHTHTAHTQRSVQGVSVVWSLSLPPFGSSQANRTGLALPRTQRAHGRDLRKSSELLRKGFFFFLLGNPFHAQMIDDDKKESVGPVDRLRTAACSEKKSVPIETERFLSTLERSRLLSPRLVNRLWLKIEG